MNHIQIQQVKLRETMTINNKSKRTLIAKTMEQKCYYSNNIIQMKEIQENYKHITYLQFPNIGKSQVRIT